MDSLIITLCGSARFEAQYHYWNERLTMDGHTIFALTTYPSIKGKHEWYTPQEKELLDAAHFRKINASQAIFVIDQEYKYSDIYIGESTRMEIMHATTAGKKIYRASEACRYLGCPSRMTQKPPCPLCYE